MSRLGANRHHGNVMAANHEQFVEPDAFRVAREAVLLVADLRAALAICVYDDTQGVGGMLHMKYVATSEERPLDLTDNTLSSGILLMDRFCKELRAIGARKQSWQVTICAHVPNCGQVDEPAATVVDLVKAYYADSRRAVVYREFREPPSVRVSLHAREGYLASSPTPASA